MALHLSDLDDCALLGQSGCVERSGVDDGAQLLVTIQTFRDMGVPDAETAVVFGVVAALGNVSPGAVESTRRPWTPPQSATWRRRRGCWSHHSKTATTALLSCV